MSRKLLYPFSLLYGGVMQLRNKFYDEGIFSSRSFEVPVIAVGNLSVGGTGKSPMIEYLINVLKDDLRVATLSRGYKRTTKGFHLLEGNESAAEVGDEPLQFKNKFPEVQVAVDEKRVEGIERLLGQENPPEVILLDDAFQHRKVAANFYILLTPYSNLYINDLVLPAGNLREPKMGAKRADIVVVTKCPANLSEVDQQRVRNRLQLEAHQKLFFSRISYSESVLGGKSAFPVEELQKKHFELVTGIANPKPLVEYLKERQLNFSHRVFPDHHNFSRSELSELRATAMILTTEKDYMRLKNDISEESLFYLPIKIQLVSREQEFEELIKWVVNKK